MAGGRGSDANITAKPYLGKRKGDEGGSYYDGGLDNGYGELDDGYGESVDDGDRFMIGNWMMTTGDWMMVMGIG